MSERKNNLAVVTSYMISGLASIAIGTGVRQNYENNLMQCENDTSPAALTQDPSICYKANKNEPIFALSVEIAGLSILVGGVVISGISILQPDLKDS